MGRQRPIRRFSTPYAVPFATRDRPKFEYHTISCEGPIDPDQRAALEANNWELFSVVGPMSAEDRRRDHHFRRPAGSATST